MGRCARVSLEARLRSLALKSAYRIFGLAHLDEPLKVRPFPSRFCDGVSGYAVLYVAVSFETCFLETVARDRFARRTQRELPLATILARAWAHIATKPNAALNVLDLRGSVVWKSARRRMPLMRDIWQQARRWGARCMRSIATLTGSFTHPGSVAMIASRYSIGQQGRIEGLSGVAGAD